MSRSFFQPLTRWQLALVVTGVFLLSAPVAFASTSAWVFPGTSGRLLSAADALGNRVLDFSSAGYKGGRVPLPLSNSVPVRTNLSAVAGDNWVSIQSAINYVQSLPLDANGFRGAVLLNAGVYALSNTLSITASGVVLRGVGSGTNGTVLRATTRSQYTLVKISGSSSATTVSGTTHTITNRYVPVGARSFLVDSTSGLAVGDYVGVYRPSTSAWIHDLGMDLLGPMPDAYPWPVSTYNIDMDRVITRIEGNRIFIDVPVTCAIDAGYANGTIRKLTRSGRITNSGIEHIRGVSDYNASVTDDENHASTFVNCNGLENGWVRDVVSQYFVNTCVYLSGGCKFVTVADSQCLDPISQITGGRRYAFSVEGAVSCLVANCYTRQDRHQFVTLSRVTGPNVFVDGLSDTAYADAGPHERWATGMLWDNITVNGNSLNIQNRGNLGSGHGWSGANCVAYNCDADGGYVVQNPPGAHNWLIGSIGTINNGTYYVGPHAPGTYDSNGTNVFPNSLYYAQLQDRLAAPNLVTREYWLGEIDRFTTAPEAVPLDTAWSNAVRVVAGAKPLDGFDVVATNHWVPFTFNYVLAPGDRIIGASLTVAMRAASSSTDQTLYLDSTTNAFSFTSLGWLPIGTGTNTTVRVLDLMSQTNRLADGQFNFAVAGSVGIDWALLQLDVAPDISGGDVTTLTPVADATVNGGVNANVNYGTATTLTVKEDTSSDFDRKAFLRWDLSSVAGTVYSAKIRLTPVSVGTNVIETGVTVSTNNTWTETGITWNNQPAVGKRFTTWIPGTNNAPVEFMVTPQVLNALNGDKKLSVQLYSLRYVGSAGIVTYASREAVDASTRPQLILLTLSPPTISDLTNRLVAVNGNTGPLAFTVSDSQTAASNLVVSAVSSDPNLVPAASLVFGGSGTNRTLTVTPAANQSGIVVITVTVTDATGLTASDSFTLTVANHPPGVFLWNGPGAGANNWSTPGNWIPTGPPEALDDVKFFDPGAGGVTVSNVNSVVDAGFAGSIASLQIGNTNGNHTLGIADGLSLDVSGANDFIAGTETDNGGAQVVYATITGAGGTLNFDNSSADMIVRQGSGTSGSHRATLDMSGLGNFNATLGRLLIGVAGPNRPAGTLWLARTNDLTFTGASAAIDVADSGANSGSTSYLYLGIENQIEADIIIIGRSKSSALLAFNPAFTNLQPTLFLRGTGGGRMDLIALGDNSSGNGVSSSSSSGTMNLSGGTVDAEVDLFFVGKGQTSSGAGATGALTLTDGLLDVNTLEVGYQNAANAAAVVTGTVNVRNSAALVVNSTLRLARYTGSGTLPVGALNLDGGAVTVDGDIVAGGGTSSIAINGGALAVNGRTGTPTAPVGNMVLTNATLQFAVAPGVTNVVVASLTTGGSSNVISVLSLPAAAVPTRLPLLDYAGTIGGAGFNFVLGGGVPGYGSYLSNNVANSSVDLVFVSLPATPPSFSAVTRNGSSLVLTGTNGIPNWPYYVLASTNLALPLAQWPCVATNFFDGAGNFTFTNSPNASMKFYLLQLPGTVAGY